MEGLPLTPTDDGDDEVLAAVQTFLQLRAAGESVGLDSYLNRFPTEMRERVRSQCELAMSLDDWVGAEPAGAADEVVRIGDYILHEEVGRGGMGVVYRAEQVSLKREVALKVMSRGLSLSDRHVQRFRAEAKATAGLNHEGIVPIYAAGEVDGTLYFAMEFIRGADLGTRIRRLRDRAARGDKVQLGAQRRRTYVQAVAEVCAQVADALQAAHEAGVIHRDIKPSNVLIGREGRAHVVDFGLSKIMGERSVSMSGELTGTPHYMSPEQTLAKRAPVDHRTDVFSLGVILYELLTFQQPFTGDNLHTILHAICFRDPQPILQIKPNVPRDLVTICDKAMEKDPGRRYQTAGELAADLRRFASFEPIRARPAGLGTRLRKWVQRNPTIATISGAALAILFLWSGWGVYAADSRARDRAAAIARHDEALANGDYPKAIDHMVHALSLSPGDRELTLRLRSARESFRAEQAVTGRLLAQSAEAIQEDPDLAVRLVLTGLERARRPDPQTRRVANETVLSALSRRVESRPLRSGNWRTGIDAALAKDGRFAATASAFGEIFLWDLKSEGKGVPEHAVLRGHVGHVWTLALSPDERLLASGGDDSTVRIWDLETRSVIEILRGHGFKLRGVVFSPDGRHLLSWDVKGNVMVWNAHDGTRVHVHEADRIKVRAAAFTPDGLSYYVTYRPRRRSSPLQIVVREVAGKREPVVIEDPAPSNRLIAPKLHFDGSGRFALKVLGRGALQLFRGKDLLPDEPIPIHRRPLTTALSPDGERLVVAGKDSSLALISLADLTADGGEREADPILPTVELTGPSRRVETIRFSGDGSRLAVGTVGGEIWVYDAATCRKVAAFRTSGGIIAVELDYTGRFVLTRDSLEAPRVWDVDEHRPVREFAARAAAVRDLDVRGDRMVVAFSDPGLRIFARSTGRLLAELPTERPIEQCRFSRDGERLLLRSKRYLEVRDGAATSVVASFTMPNSTGSLSADGSKLAVGDIAGRVTVLDVATKKKLLSFSRESRIRTVTFDPTGSRIAVIEYDAACRIYDIASGELVRELTTASLPVAMMWPATGDTLVIACGDGVIHVFDPRSGELRREFANEGECILRADLSADGHRLVVGADDRSVRLFDVTTGELVTRFTEHIEPLHVARMAPDGDYVVTGDRSGRMFHWTTRPVDAARELGIRELRLKERERFDVLEPIDTECREFVDRLYEKHVLTRDVLAEIRKLPDGDPRRARAEAYACERPNRWGSALREVAFRIVHSPDLQPAALDRARRFAHAAHEILAYDALSGRAKGFVLFRSGRYKEAFEALDKPWTRPNSKSPSTVLRGYRAMALWELGRKADALAELEAYRELARDFFDARTHRILAEAERRLQAR